MPTTQIFGNTIIATFAQCLQSLHSLPAVAMPTTKSPLVLPSVQVESVNPTEGEQKQGHAV